MLSLSQPTLAAEPKLTSTKSIRTLPMTKSAHKVTPRRTAFNKVSHTARQYKVLPLTVSPSVRPTKGPPGGNPFSCGFGKHFPFPACRHQGL
jgi:hypothetical protein